MKKLIFILIGIILYILAGIAIYLAAQSIECSNIPYDQIPLDLDDKAMGLLVAFFVWLIFGMMGTIFIDWKYCMCRLLKLVLPKHKDG